MFDKVKQVGNLMKMRSEAQKLQKELEQIVKTVEKKGWKVSVTGDQKIRYIKNENGEDMPELVEAINDALKDVQKEAAKKMMEMGGGLGGLLGKM
jgi:DNA-binding protein YbaB